MADICLEEKVLISFSAQSQRWCFKDGVPWQRAYVLLLRKFSTCSSLTFLCKSQLGLCYRHSCVCASVSTVCILSYTHPIPGLALKFAMVRPVLTPPSSPLPPPSNSNIICIQHSGTETITMSSSTPWHSALSLFTERRKKKSLISSCYPKSEKEAKIKNLERFKFLLFTLLSLRFVCLLRGDSALSLEFVNF